jgi:hypothetical protein
MNLNSYTSPKPRQFSELITGLNAAGGVFKATGNAHLKKIVTVSS